MKNESSNVLGHLIEVTGEYFTATLTSDLEGLSSDKMIGMDKVRIGQVGSYLMVRQSGLYVLVIVESLWQEVDAGGALMRMVKLNPLGEITAKGGFDRGVSHFPTTGAELHLVSAATLEAH